MTMTDIPGAELAVRAQPLLPIAADDARQAMTAYQDVCKAILTADDMQRVGDREFVKRAGFQKLAAAYGVSTEIVSLDVTGTGDEENMVARAVVRATHPSGRHAEGDGACSSHERRFRRGAEKIDHDLPATAVTRATNRAISNLVAFGTVSAEEAEADDRSTSPAPAWAKPTGDIAEVAEALTELFKAAGIEKPAGATSSVGNDIFNECDGTVPVCVTHTIQRIALQIAGAAANGEPVATVTPADFITWEDRPDSNERIYQHPGCDGRGATWMTPLDDCPPHAEGETDECANCAAVFPLRPHTTDKQEEKAA